MARTQSEKISARVRHAKSPTSSKLLDSALQIPSTVKLILGFILSQDFMLNSALCEVTVTQTMDADMDDSDHSNHHPEMEFDHRVSQSLSRLTIGSSTQAARDGARVEQARGTSPNKTLTKSRIEIGGVTRI